MLKGGNGQAPQGWSICRTFIYQFNFQFEVKTTYTLNKVNRNPIYLAREYKQMIDSGQVKNQAELLGRKGISKARVPRY